MVGTSKSRSARTSMSRRSSSVDRLSRRGSISSVDSSYNDENNHEMYAGAASEVIPSSISSLHYPHHFSSYRRDSNVSRETSPLIVPSTSYENNENELYSIKSNATGRSVDTQVNFKFFSPDEIEMAPGGSTLENPEDPVDYNTDWDYSLDKYDSEEYVQSTPGSNKLKGISPKHDIGIIEEESTSPRTGDRSQEHDDSESGYGSINTNLDDVFRPRRGSSTSSKSDNESSRQSFSSNVKDDEDILEFPAVLEYQRYYLAEEDLVIGIAGYKNSFRKLFLYYCLCIFTFGLGYLVLRWFPRYRINLMGAKSSLGKCDWCVIENEFGELSIVQIRKQRYGERLSNILPITEISDDDINDVDNESQMENRLSDLLHNKQTKENNPVIPVIRSFNYRYIKFFYNPVEDIFRTNSTWYDLDWLNIRHLKNGVTQSMQDQRRGIFGENNIEIEEKSITQLLMDEVLHPFYIFQIFSIFLWLADDYYYYALCIFIISLISIINTLVETKSTIKRLQEISKFKCDIRAWRNEFWTQIDSNELVPGDVFEIDPLLSVIPSDCLLINGECIINESMLTGESVPVTKVQANQETVKYLKENFTNPVLAKSFLYNGTKILKCKSNTDEPVLAMVLKIGFNTTKGSLIRSMLFPKPTGFKFYEDSFKYIGFMTFIAFIGFIYSTYNFIQLGIDKSIMVLRALDIITIVVPPALPATLTIGTTFAINRLKNFHSIFCIAPTRVNIGGKLDVICFDKTGTLTEDGLDVLGVHVTKNAHGRKQIIFEELKNEVSELRHRGDESFSKLMNFGFGLTHGNEKTFNSSEELVIGMAVCHSLRLIDDELLGDPLDVKMFEYLNWKLEDHDGIKVYPGDSVLNEAIRIIKEYEFISSLRRMSVMVEKADGTKNIFTKGAPEVMIDICRPETIPLDYEEVLHEYTKRGYRVIALGSKELEEDDGSRDQMEKELQFNGFIIFENKLKESTKPTLEELNQAQIRTIMCTGDNVLTAISVGIESGIISKDIDIYVPRYDPEDNDTNLVWEGYQDNQLKLDSYTLKPYFDNIREEVKEYRIAITGDIFKYILIDLIQQDGRFESLKEKILMKCDIFARMSPDEKHELVEQLQKIDYTVGFVGDGANDCGALKAADVGVSLSEAEASVAAPFTSRIFEIKCILDIIKEGRSSLVTSFSCFKYMSLYLAIQFITVSILYKRGTNLGDFQFLYIDLFLILPLAIFMSWLKPFNKIIIKRPSANLVSAKILIPLVLQIIVILIFQIIIWKLVQLQQWYIKPIPAGDDDVKSSDNTVLFLYTNFQYILIAIVLSRGPPYRQPIYENWPFLLNLIITTLISSLLFKIDQNLWLGDFMQLTNMSSTMYSTIIVLSLINLVVMIKGEESWFTQIAAYYKSLLHRPRQSKKRFKNLLIDFEKLEVV